MKTSGSDKDIDFGGPATYRIVVQGTLSEDWRDRLGGFSMNATSRGDKAAQTTLMGRVRDQAELSGILDFLYGVHLPILKVENIDDVP
jgi:hypothetical protein